MKITLVCGEASGDALGAGLALAILARDPGCELVGVTGPLMREAGVQNWLDCSRFSVMGYLEALRRLPGLLWSRREVLWRIEKEKPAVVVGIDAPDLNLELGRKAKELGAKYVQYVCPSFWAWRPERAEFLARHCDMVLALLPFEVGFCEKAGVKATFVGHRLASEIQEDPDARKNARKDLGIDEQATVLALLPGSRPQELAVHAKLFSRAATLCREKKPDLQLWWAPRQGLEKSLPALPGSSSCPGKARALLAAADAALVKSGTVTLEAALSGCPQVIAYSLGLVGGLMARHKVKDPYNKHYGLPNLLAGRQVVPEFVQDRAVPAAIADALLPLLDKKGTDEMKKVYREIRVAIEGDADARAAAAVLGVAG